MAAEQPEVVAEQRRGLGPHWRRVVGTTGLVGGESHGRALVGGGPRQVACGGGWRGH